MPPKLEAMRVRHRNPVAERHAHVQPAPCYVQYTLGRVGDISGIGRHSETRVEKSSNLASIENVRRQLKADWRIKAVKSEQPYFGRSRPGSAEVARRACERIGSGLNCRSTLH
jgi:hypothetical protein